MCMPSPHKNSIFLFQNSSFFCILTEIAKDILIESNKRPRSSALDTPSQPCPHTKKSSSASPQFPSLHKYTAGPGTLSSGGREHTRLEPYCVPSTQQCSQKHVSNKRTIGKLPKHQSARMLKGMVTNVQGCRVSARLYGKKNETDFVELLPGRRRTVLMAFTCHVTECSHHPSNVGISGQ